MTTSLSQSGAIQTGPAGRAGRSNFARRGRWWRYWALIPILAVAVWVTIAPPYANSPPIRSDGIGYYAWTEAILHGNFNFCQWPSLTVADADLQHNPRHPERCQLAYPPGLALLRFPVMAPLALIADRSQAKDIVVSGAEEKASLWLGAVALGLECWFVLLAMRRLRVRPAVANMMALGACFGTGLFHYATYDSSFTHVYSAALFAGLLLLGVVSANARRLPNPWLVFGLCLLISLVREPNIPVLGLGIVAWLVWRVRALPVAERRRAALRVGLPAGLAIFLVLAFQLLYNRWASGVWTLNSYGAEKFTPGAFNQAHVLFSYNHGLFVWYPVIVLMLAVAFWERPSRYWAAVATGMIVILTIIYGSWPSWYLGGAFGLRGFVDIVPFITVAGAIGISSVDRRWVRLIWIGGLVILSLATVELMAAYWKGTLPYGNDTGQQYWSAVVGSNSLLHGHLG